MLNGKWNCERKAANAVEKGLVDSKEEYLEKHKGCPAPDEYDDL